jgi:HEAT repeat protein
MVPAKDTPECSAKRAISIAACLLLIACYLPTPQALAQEFSDAELIAAARAEGEQNFQAGLQRYKNKDLKGARVLWRAAAFNGHAEAMYKLATMHELGDGFGNDPHRAIKLYRRAADYDHTGAMMKVGEIEDWEPSTAVYFDKVVPVLIDRLRDKNSFVRFTAIRALKRIGPAAHFAEPDIMRALDDKESLVRQTAVAALLSVRRTYRQEDPPLVRALNHIDPEVSIAARRALEAMVSKDEAKLSKYLQDTNPKVRDGTVQVLKARGKASVSLLIKLMSDKDRLIRIGAAKALDGMGPAASKAIPALLKAATNVQEGGFVRASSIKALGGIGKGAIRNEQVLPALKKLLMDTNGSIHTAAAEALGKIGPAGFTVLIDVLKNGDKWVRFHTAETLGLMGPAAKDAVPALVDLLKDKDQDVRDAAKEALKKIQAAK